MRFAALLAAVVALWVQPAAAVILPFGLAFEGTRYFDDRYGEYPLPTDPTRGGFDFDTDTNLVTFFYIDLGTPIFDLDQDINAMLAAHPGCDVDCFVTAINGSAWRFEGTGGLGNNARLDLEFTGGGFNDMVSKSFYVGNPPYNFGEFGTYSVRGPIPEPSTWALMLLGFGVIGWAMRNQRSYQAISTFGQT